MSAKKFQLTVNQVGIGPVIVDGHDISDMVRSVTVYARAGQLTEVRLRLLADVTIEADAEVVDLRATPEPTE